MKTAAILAALAATGCAHRLAPRPISDTARTAIESALAEMRAATANTVFQPTEKNQ